MSKIQAAWDTIHYFMTGTNTWNSESYILSAWWNRMSDARYAREELDW